ncbi:hypothetical protein [Aquamicrobium sp.]|uniref:hypothetical protein n=1 Tax=Aquamicrobium sp. TaxID=1872579 RepID=UPI0025899243|nr:hypothetical protein [Aquamicrobium sp.]MCK9549300.1 hypothetical protein [Aquamicrobium sp.]
MKQSQIIFSCDWRNDLIGTKIYTDSPNIEIQTIKEVEERFDSHYPKSIRVSFEETKWRQIFSGKEHLLNWVRILKEQKK